MTKYTEEISEETDEELYFAIEEGNLKDVEHIINSLSPKFLKSCLDINDLICNALEFKHLEVAKFLIRQSLNIGELKYHHHSELFHSAVAYGDLEIVDMLAKKGAFIHLVDSEGVPPFHAIAWRKPFDDEGVRIFEFFLSKDVKIDLTQTWNEFTIVHEAAKCGNLELLKFLNSREAKLNIRGRDGLSPLHIAAMYGYSDVVSFLLECRVKHSATDNCCRIPLGLAAAKGDIPTIKILFNRSLSAKEIGKGRRSNIEYFGVVILFSAVILEKKKVIEALLKKGTKINALVLEIGKAALHIAVETGKQEFVKLLLKRGADVNLKQERPDKSVEKPKWPTNPGYTALHIAVEKGDEAMVKLLLENKADSELSDAREQTPLHIAIEKGQEKIVRLFLEKGISLDYKTQMKLTPIHLAAQKGNVEILSLLLQHGVNPAESGSTEFDTPLVCAAQAGNLEAVGILSKICLTSERKCSEAYPALYMASYHGRENVVSFLLNNGADPNFSLSKCLPPMHAAAQQGHDKVVELLLKRGAKVDPKDEAGDEYFSTPLLAASKSGHEKIIKMLLEQGADINRKLGPKTEDDRNAPDIRKVFTWGDYNDMEIVGNYSITGYTPLLFAVESGKKSIFDLILKYAPDLNGKSERDVTPLGIAVQKKNLSFVQSLLAAGAISDVQVENQPALCFAIRKKNAKLVELLLNYGASVNFALSYNSKEKDYSFYRKLSGDGYTPLHLAILEKNLEIVEMLLKRGASLDTDTDQDLPLHFAIRVGNLEIVHKLLEFGARINSQCKKGLTPFFHAIESNKLDILKSLVKKEVSVETETANRTPLLHFAINSQVDEKMIDFLLLNFGINTNVKNKKGLSLVQHFLQERHEKEKSQFHYMYRERYEIQRNKVLNILLEYYSDPNYWSEEGKTPLHFAASKGQANAAELLLNYGADIDVIDFHGNTPYTIVVEQFTRLVTMIQDNYFRDEDESDEEEMQDIFFRQMYAESQRRIFEKRRIYDLRDSKYYFNEDRYRKDFEPFTVLNDPKPFRLMAKLMTQVLAKMEAENVDITQENLESMNNPFVKPYYELCKLEMKQMKEIEIVDGVSFFDIITASEMTLATYLRNHEIMETAKSETYRLLFPTYARFLRIRLQRAMKRKVFIEKNLEFFKKALRLEIPIIVTCEIFDYLSLFDLRNLSRACKPKYSKIFEVQEDSDWSDDSVCSSDGREFDSSDDEKVEEEKSSRNDCCIS